MWLSVSLCTDKITGSIPGDGNLTEQSPVTVCLCTHPVIKGFEGDRLSSDILKRSTSDRNVAGLSLTGGKKHDL